MADSLRDQLVKAGLATSGQARKAERQKRAEEQARRHGQKKAAGNSEAKLPDPGSTADVKRRAAKLAAEKAASNRAIAASQNSKQAVRALRAEIKQIILQNDQRARVANDDDVPYNFVHGKKIKRIHIPKEQQKQLGNGSLVIVNNDGRYHLISREVAQQISARDPKRIIAAHDPGKQETEDDEYYARFKIPDDLDW